MIRRRVKILAIVLVAAGFWGAGHAQAVELNASIKGAAPLMLSYYSEKTGYDIIPVMGPSYGSSLVDRHKPAYHDQSTGASDANIMVDHQTLIINLFEIELDSKKRKNHIVTFGMSALSNDHNGAVDPANYSMSATFDSTVPFPDGKPAGIFERIKETLLLFHLTIRY